MALWIYFVCWMCCRVYLDLLCVLAVKWSSLVFFQTSIFRHCWSKWFLLPNDRVTCVRYFQAAFNGTRGRERTVLDLGKVLNGQGTSLLPCPRNYSRNKMFSPELKWKADTTKALNEEIIDSLAPGTEGIAHYLDVSKNWLCLLAGGPTSLWKLLSMLTIKLPNSLLLSNSFKMNNLDLSVIPFRELSVVRMYFRSSFLSISINQYDWGKYDILMEISMLHGSFHIIRLVIFRMKNLGLIFSLSLKYSLWILMERMLLWKSICFL